MKQFSISFLCGAHALRTTIHTFKCIWNRRRGDDDEQLVLVFEYERTYVAIIVVEDNSMCNGGFH